MLFPHLLQAVPGLSFCGLINILKLISRIPRKRISILLNIYGNWSFKNWSKIKTKYNLEEKVFYKWCQHFHAIPNQWKGIIKINNESCIYIVYLDHHLVKNNRIVASEKPFSKEIYSLIISQNISTPKSHQYFRTFFPHLNLDWKLIYILPRILTKNTSLKDFQ